MEIPRGGRVIGRPPDLRYYGATATSTKPERIRYLGNGSVADSGAPLKVLQPEKQPPAAGVETGDHACAVHPGSVAGVDNPLN
jgi:hypothetical protein